MEKAKYKVVDLSTYYRKGVYEHFTKDCKCSFSITSKIDVTPLYNISKETNTKFHINFLYLLTKVLNTRDDYKMDYLYKENKVVVYEKLNVTHYVFHPENETCSTVYTEFDDNYKVFYKRCLNDLESAKKHLEYGLDAQNHPNYYDASYISWLHYSSLNIELPDGYLYFLPIINWGRYQKEGEKLMMPLSVRMNHAVADGYLVSKVFLLLQEEIDKFKAK